MADDPKHKNKSDSRGFSKGKGEAPRKSTPKAKDTAKTREAKASKGGRRERETK